MKKTTLIIIALFALIANGNAQALPVLLYEGEEVVNGTEFTVYESPRLGWHQIELQVKNASEENAFFRVRKTVISEVEGSLNYFCFFGCKTPQALESQGELVLLPDAFELFSGDYEQVAGVDGITTVRYDFFNLDHPTETAIETIYIIVNYVNGNLVNVDNLAAGSYFNVLKEGRKIQFAYDLQQNSTLFVYSTSGQVVATQPMAAGANQITLASNLQQGMYVYVLKENNKTLKTGKFAL